MICFGASQQPSIGFSALQQINTNERVADPVSNPSALPSPGSASVRPCPLQLSSIPQGMATVYAIFIVEWVILLIAAYYLVR